MPTQSLTAIFLIGMMCCSGCAGTSRAVKHATSSYPEAENVSTWPDDYPLRPDQDYGVAELGRTESSSVHVVQIRHREVLHTHQTHDLIAVVLRGHGTLRLGSRMFAMKEGSVVSIPRGTPHAFVNESDRPAAVFVVFTPPFDGKDTVPVQE